MNFVENLFLKAPGKDQIIEGLYACGECACVSVHGANRLGANSLLETIVFGKAVADTISQTSCPGEEFEMDEVFIILHHKSVLITILQTLGLSTLENFNRLRQANGKVTVGTVRLTLQKTMQKHAAVFRTQDILAAGCTSVAQIYQEFCNIKVSP